MNKYSIYIPWHCSFVIEVEAENEKQALEEAYRGRPSVCFHCSDTVQIEEQNTDCEPEVTLVETQESEG